MPVAAVVVAGIAWAAEGVGIVTAIGATIGAVGAVTGSKDLMKIGSVVGLAGGIGQMANAGTFDSMLGTSWKGTLDATGGFGNYGLIGSASQSASSATDAFKMPVSETFGSLPSDSSFITQTENAGVSTSASTVPDYLQADMTKTAAGTNSPNYLKADFTKNIGPTENLSFFDKFKKAGETLLDAADKHTALAMMTMNGIASAADPTQRALREAQAKLDEAQTNRIGLISSNLSTPLTPFVMGAPSNQNTTIAGRQPFAQILPPKINIPTVR